MVDLAVAVNSMSSSLATFFKPKLPGWLLVDRFWKTQFVRFTKTLELFYRVVHHFDPSFSQEEANEFIHRCLRNVKQRCRELRGKKPVSRKRKRRNEVLQETSQDEGDADDEVEGDEQDEYSVEETVEEVNELLKIEALEEELIN